MESIISVKHECADGWHTFTSPQVPGLYLVGRDDDLEGIYQAIPDAIARLALADFGVKVVVRQEKTFSSCVEGLPNKNRAEIAHYSVVPRAA